MSARFKGAVRNTVALACMIVAVVMIGKLFKVNVSPLGGSKIETEQKYHADNDHREIDGDGSAEIGLGY